jgi:putative ABC transport system ATP-binding protein
MTADVGSREPELEEPAVHAHGLRFVRAGQVILDDVSIEVAAGERVALVGPSGSGKTTVLTMLAGLLQPDAGRLRSPGGTALVLQGYGLLSLLTAAENIEVALRAAERQPAEAVGRAAAALADLDLEAQADQLVGGLSGGQQQRVAVARALALAPLVLLADEPTAEQDPAHRELVVERLLTLQHPEGALVLATHDPSIARRCDRVVELHEGRVVGAKLA